MINLAIKKKAFGAGIYFQDFCNMKIIFLNVQHHYISIGTILIFMECLQNYYIDILDLVNVLQMG